MLTRLGPACEACGSPQDRDLRCGYCGRRTAHAICEACSEAVTTLKILSLPEDAAAFILPRSASRRLATLPEREQFRAVV